MVVKFIILRSIRGLEFGWACYYPQLYNDRQQVFAVICSEGASLSITNLGTNICIVSTGFNAELRSSVIRVALEFLRVKMQHFGSWHNNLYSRVISHMLYFKWFFKCF